MGQKKPLSLRDFIAEQIEKIGIDEFKHKFGVGESTINTWRRADSVPRPQHLLKLIELSNFRLTGDAIAREAMKRRAAKKATARLA